MRSDRSGTGANVVDVGDELAAEFVDQVEQAVAIEVDPDEGAGDAALVAGEAAGGKIGGYGVGTLWFDELFHLSSLHIDSITSIL